MRKIIMFIVFVFSCTLSAQFVYKPFINKQFTKYVDSFVKYSDGLVEKSMHLLDVTIQFADLEEGTIGTCLALPWNKEIEIDRKWWAKTTNKLQREELIFHELGHCVLYRPHTAAKNKEKNTEAWIEDILFEFDKVPKIGYLKDHCPASYMHPYSIDLKCIEKHREYYIEEMFENFVIEILYEEDIIEEEVYNSL